MFTDKSEDQMKMFLALMLLFTSAVTNAQSQIFAKLCTKEDIPKLTAVLKDMQTNGFMQYILDQAIGYAPEDCTPNSLEQIAGRPNSTDILKASCGIRLILNYDSKVAAEQAAWILDNAGDVYRTKDGISVQLCARKSRPSPVPGITVHN
jgi:hypothetical protein